MSDRAEADHKGIISHPNIPGSVAAAVDTLIRGSAVQRVILFGSRAVGDHDERSDVDLAICAPRITRSELALLRDRLSVARTLYRVAISPLEGMPELLKARVLELGVTIYEREETSR